MVRIIPHNSKNAYQSYKKDTPFSPLPPTDKTEICAKFDTMVSLYPYMSNIVIEVKKNPNENNTSLLRRFSRRVQESSIIQKVKSLRYNERETSKLSQKNSALKRLNKRKEIEKLRKLGKMIER